MWTTLIDLFIPARCAVCSRRLGFDDVGVCPDCSSLFGGVQVEVDGLGACCAGAPYTGELIGAIRRLKFDDETWRAPGLGERLARVEPICDLLALADEIVPVPLAPGRLLERGYNQSWRIARHAGAVANRPVRARLRRVRETSRQTALDAASRRTIAGAFVARGVAGRRIVLIDDVVTTGATMAACAHALRQAGAIDVLGVAVAATPLRRAAHALDVFAGA